MMKMIFSKKSGSVQSNNGSYLIQTIPNIKDNITPNQTKKKNIFSLQSNIQKSCSTCYK